MTCRRALALSIAGLLMVGPGAALAANSQSTVFFIDLTVTKSLTARLNAAKIAAGQPSNFSGVNPAYQAQLQSLDSQTLYTTPLPLNFTFYADPIVGQRDEVRFALKLPYFLTAQSLQLLNDGRVFGSVDLVRALCPAAPDGQCSEFCTLKKTDPDCFRCGNGVCEPGESAATCPTDCATVLTAAPRPAPDFTPLLALAILGLAGVGVAGWQYWRRGR